jgi:hypothetical protein
MSHIVKEIKNKDLFRDMSLNNVILSRDRGITMIAGQLKDGGHVALQALAFDDKKWDDLQILDWMKNNFSQIQLTASLPDEASGLWLIEYNRACLEGKSSDEASEGAWSVVKAKWYQDRDGQWYRFSDKWDKAVLANDRPTLEILKVGKYPQFVSEENPEGVLAEADLDLLVTNFDKHNTVPVTVDHQQAGTALGWADRLWRQGQSLFATLRNLSTEFAKQVKAGAYKNRSVEIHKNFDFNGQRIGKTLTAISFLGAITPQVKGMLEPKFSATYAGLNHRGGGYLLSIDDNKSIYDLSEKYIDKNIKSPPYKPKGEKTVELTEQQLAEMKQKAADDAVAKLKVENEAILKVQTDENAKLKAQIDESRKKQIAVDADAAYAKLAEKGKILPTGKDRFLTLFRQEAEAGRDPAQTVVPLFAELPDKINLNELTKESDQDHPPADEVQFADATEESKDRLKKIYAYMDAQKWPRDDAAKIKLASAYVDRMEKK